MPSWYENANVAADTKLNELGAYRKESHQTSLTQDWLKYQLENNVAVSIWPDIILLKPTQYIWIHKGLGQLTSNNMARSSTGMMVALI